MVGFAALCAIASVCQDIAISANATNVFLVWLPTDSRTLHAAMPQHTNRLDAFPAGKGRVNEFTSFRRARKLRTVYLLPGIFPRPVS